MRKIRLISNFMTSEPVQKKFAVQALPNISRGKSNQPMKFGKIIKYNKENNFLQKSYRKCGRETSFRPLFVF